MRFIPATEAVDALHDLLAAYYREGEDADTPQEELDGFIFYLTGLLESRILLGDIALDGETPVGFVLYALDGGDYPFPECPELGTIAEISVTPDRRAHGLGCELVQRAENALRDSCRQMYICAHASAQSFWEKRGYSPCGRTAANGLPLLIKAL